MKNNKKRQKNVYKKHIVFLLILLVIILLIFLNVKNKNNIQKIALGENALDVGGEQLDISNVISAEPNAPVIGAGMIPIKWNESIGMWQITTEADSEWYNYANGKWANVMLSDGYYKSELQVGVAQEQLAEKNEGAHIKEEQLGTIFAWVPRIAYLENRVEFLKNTNVLDYMWTTESCFNLEKYGANYLDLGFTGIWVGQTEFASAAEVSTKNSEMLKEDNVQGLIANEQVTSLAKSEKTAVEKLLGKYIVIQNKTMLQGTVNYRQVIKIVNTNSRLPIMGTHVVADENIIIKDKYSENGLKYVVDKNGTRLERNTAPVDQDELIYTFYMVDNIGNVRKYKMTYGVGNPYLKGYNKSSTFYVTYDENGNENSTIPIGEKAPANWYNYENQQWANIVVRNSGNETYYVWIPRYMYKLNSSTQTVDARFVDLDNIWTEPETGKMYDLDGTGYILPEAFTWEDPEDSTKVVQLSGFWASKYKLRAGSSYNPEITGGSAVIRINNVIEKIGADYTYEMYLIKDGKRIVWDEESLTYVHGTTPIQLTGSYIYKDLPEGQYTVNIIVKDADGNYVRAVANHVKVFEKIEPSIPDLTGFNKNLTFYVTYDANGNEQSYIPIGDEPPENWYNYDKQQWANIVVRDKGTESYFTWIPRYEYKLDTLNQKTITQFIKTEQVVADEGYIIPEAFTWEDPNDSTKVVQLSGFWASKYKLRSISVCRLDATVAAGGNKIRVSNVVATSTVENFTAYLIKDGKVIDTGVLVNGEHTFTVAETGNYSVAVKQWSATDGMVAGFAKEVTLHEIEPPDVTGFRVDTTYIVTYDEEGNEDKTQTLQSVLKDGYTIDSTTNALVSGQIDVSKINGVWYDYAEQKWANIVTINNGKTIYYTWIPRYEYQLDATKQKVKAILIPKSQSTPDTGYIIPEAFTWEDPKDSTKVVQLSGFWASKYKLRS